MSQRLHSEPELSVVIAVGDHEETIGHLIRCVAAHLTELGRPFEILAVNAGSHDNSLSIASVLVGTIPELRVLARDAAGRAFLRGDLGGARRRGRAAGRRTSRRRWRRWPGRCRASAAGATRSCCAAATWSRVASRRCRSSCAPAARALLFEAVFERRAQELGIDIVGSRPRSPMPLLLRPVLRFLAA